jgi:hypothetical protein
MCFKKIYDYFFEKKYDITPPANTQDVTWSELYTVLRAEFPQAQIVQTDRHYKTTTFDEYDRFIQWNMVDKRQYISDYYDCDDFSLSLMGEITIPEWSALAFGILFTKTPDAAHAVNVFIDNDREVWIVEPQTDAIFKCPSNWTPYFILM